MSRLGALLLLGMLTLPTWAQPDETKQDSSSDTPTLPDEQPIYLPSPVKPPEEVTPDPVAPTLPDEQPVDLPPPVAPPPAVTFDPNGETVPEISTPPEILYMNGPDNHGGINTTCTCIPKVNKNPEPSTLLLEVWELLDGSPILPQAEAERGGVILLPFG